MAKKQTRRCVSLNRADYEAAKQEAARRGLTLVALVEAGLAAIGVPIVVHAQQPVARVQASLARRAESMAARRARQATAQRPSRERQVLGDHAANSHGFQ
jgi:plasmid replication initiation protein